MSRSRKNFSHSIIKSLRRESVKFAVSIVESVSHEPNLDANRLLGPAASRCNVVVAAHLAPAAGDMGGGLRL